MPKRANPLDRINIASPCSSDWNDMFGNEQVRFCCHCSLFVHDLSKITRKDALKLVAASKGKLCVRYLRRPDGTVETARRAQSVTQIKRRLSRLAAGAFTATLSLAATAAAQSSPPPIGDQPAIAERSTVRDGQRPVGLDGTFASLVGTVTDPQQAVVPGAKVSLTNAETAQELNTTSNNAGEYSFQSVPGGMYKLKIEALGFPAYQQDQINLKGGEEQHIDAQLRVEMLTGSVTIISAETPLLIAILDDDVAQVRDLLARGADINALDKGMDSTALGGAVSRGNPELVQVLINAGADPNVKNGSEQTALMRLNERSSVEIVRALLDAGAKVNHKDEDGDTALHEAAALEKTEILQALLDSGAKVNARNKEGKTALMVAAEDGQLENVRALLWAGADARRKDNDGATALKYAREIENEQDNANTREQIIGLLIAYGTPE
jgi:hypothetical protein